MTWNESMYYGPFTPKRVGRLRKKIQQKKIHPNVFLVVMNGERLEIVPSLITLQKAYPVDDLEVVGMAMSKPEAYVLVQHLMQDTFLARRDLDVSAYLKEKSGKR